jgi:hypothetical protein
MKREVYVKEAKGEKMVRKFVMWKTNKEEHEDFPAYVLHFTDFSPNRKDPLAREVRTSDSEEQIHDLWNEFVEANIKRGWSLHEPSVEISTATEPEPAATRTAEAVLDTVAAPAKKKAAAKKPATKKAVVKKKTAKKKTKTAATSETKPKKKAAGKMAKSEKQTDEKAAKKKSG